MTQPRSLANTGHCPSSTRLDPGHFLPKQRAGSCIADCKHKPWRLLATRAGQRLLRGQPRADATLAGPLEPRHDPRSGLSTANRLTRREMPTLNHPPYPSPTSPMSQISRLPHAKAATPQGELVRPAEV